MQVTPRTASQAEVSCICSARFLHISINCEPLAGMPSTSFICEVMIIKATADVKPELTGPDTKSIRNPGTHIIEPTYTYIYERE